MKSKVKVAVKTSVQISNGELNVLLWALDFAQQNANGFDKAGRETVTNAQGGSMPRHELNAVSADLMAAFDEADRLRSTVDRVQDDYREDKKRR